MSKVAEYLAGERLDDVALFLTHEYLDSEGKLPNMGEEVENGYILVVPGDDGRRAFAAGTGMDAMEFAQTAMGNDGDIDHDLSSGTCPDAAPDENHEPKFIFSFAEAQNEEVGGIYEDGDVVHAYAKCTCGATYSDRWVVDDE
ncbi:hypothetical protein GJR96_05975 [Haloferax sp. MBLA0076]|uniref:Uncharacterized protein n=1 Tax=Haloferax litoreum TaxID=2666140 RepID=A0A6A8GED9_9EURY|nr:MULTISPECIES: DUF5807 family protein [Haloferax]KAB1193012.1 hypothetical protein Hfx1148_05970 [Haloferax sp. CBA1148]MRX21503.1 hypothetical protein [Haloferax litoreum]